MANLQTSAANACYWKDVWKKLYSMRNMRQLCDVTILSEDGVVFKAHSIILASGSTVFHAHFIDRSSTCMIQRDSSSIQIIGLTSDILQVTLDFIYGVTPETLVNFKKLQKGSEILGIPGARTFCTQQLQELEQLAKENATDKNSITSGNTVVSIAEKCPAQVSVIPPPGKKEANIGKCPYFSNRGSEINYFVPLKKRFLMKMLTELKKDHIKAAPGQFPKEEAALKEIDEPKSQNGEQVGNDRCTSPSSPSIISGICDEQSRSKQSVCSGQGRGKMCNSLESTSDSRVVKHDSQRTNNPLESSPKTAQVENKAESTITTQKEEAGLTSNDGDQGLMEIGDTFIDSAKDLIPHHIPDLTLGDMGVQCPHLQKLAGHVDMEADFGDEILTNNSASPLDLTHITHHESVSKSSHGSDSKSTVDASRKRKISNTTNENIEGWFMHPDKEADEQNALMSPCSEGGTKVTILGPLSYKSNSTKSHSKRRFSADNINEDLTDTFDQFTPPENEPEINSDIFSSNAQILSVTDDVGRFPQNALQIDNVPGDRARTESWSTCQPLTTTSKGRSVLPTYADAFAYNGNQISGFPSPAMHDRFSQYKHNDQHCVMSDYGQSNTIMESMVKRHDYASSTFSGSDGSAYLSPNVNPPSLSPSSVSSCNSAGSVERFADSNRVPNLMSPGLIQSTQSNPFTPFASSEMIQRPRSVNSVTHIDRGSMEVRPQSAHQYSLFDLQDISERPQSAHNMGAYECMDINSIYQGQASFNRAQSHMGASVYNPVNRIQHHHAQIVKLPHETNQYSINTSATHPKNGQFSHAFESQNQLKSCPSNMMQDGSESRIQNNVDYVIPSGNKSMENQQTETECDPVLCDEAAGVFNDTIRRQNESSTQNLSKVNGIETRRMIFQLENTPNVKTETRSDEESLFADQESSAGVQMSSTCDQMSSICDQMSSTCDQMSSTCDQMSSAGDQMSSTCDQMSSTCDQMSSTCDQMSSTCEQMPSAGDQMSINSSGSARGNDDLREQLMKGYEDKLYKCLDNVCTYSNKYIEYVLSHMYHRHGWGTPDLPCHLCDKAYFSQSQLKTHIKQCHEKSVEGSKSSVKEYPCEDCSEVFRTMQSLQTHQLKVHGKGRLFSCTDCDFKSPRKKDMQGHMISQHDKAPPGVRVFTCTHCQYKCIDKNRFSEHEASHSTVKNFACTECDNTYSTKRGLRNHLKYHSTERPHACDQCGATFKVRAKLRDHVKLMHINKGQKPYQCGHCTFRASVRGNVNQHIRNTHKGQPVVVVDTQQNLRRHVKDYDYANLSGDGIEEVRDASASGYAAKGK